jgi:hypothetical protein
MMVQFSINIYYKKHIENRKARETETRRSKPAEQQDMQQHQHCPSVEHFEDSKPGRTTI